MISECEGWSVKLLFLITPSNPSENHIQSQWFFNDFQAWGFRSMVLCVTSPSKLIRGTCRELVIGMISELEGWGGIPPSDYPSRTAWKITLRAKDFIDLWTGRLRICSSLLMTRSKFIRKAPMEPMISIHFQIWGLRNSFLHLTISSRPIRKPYPELLSSMISQHEVRKYTRSDHPFKTVQKATQELRVISKGHRPAEASSSEIFGSIWSTHGFQMSFEGFTWKRHRHPEPSSSSTILAIGSRYGFPMTHKGMIRKRDIPPGSSK